MGERFQISRHWRMNKQRYCLQGIRNEDSSVQFSNSRHYPGNDNSNKSFNGRGTQEDIKRTKEIYKAPKPATID